MTLKPPKNAVKKRMSGGSDAWSVQIYNSFHSFFNNFVRDDSFKKDTIKYAILSAVVIFVSYIIFTSSQNSEAAISDTYVYAFMICIPLIIMFGIILNVGTDSNATTMFMKTLGVVLFITLFSYLYSKMSSTYLVYASYIVYGLSFLIILVGLAIVYNFFIDKLSRLEGWSGFFAELLFFLPCLLDDLVKYIMNEINITPNSVYVFIVIEILLILIYFYLPQLVGQFTNDKDNSIVLLNLPKKLNKDEFVIASSDVLKMYQSPSEYLNNQNMNLYRDNYCLSMWVLINPQNSSTAAYTKETEIFKYAFTDEAGIQHVKPMVRYYGGGDGKDIVQERDKYIFYFSKYPPTETYDSNENASYEISLPNQKWNQFVFNYNRNNVDLFINGNLERSFSMHNAMPQYNPEDQITVGSPNGLDGSICNVVYYKHSLSPQQIALNYNVYMNSNPPVIKI